MLLAAWIKRSVLSPAKAHAYTPRILDSHGTGEIEQLGAGNTSFVTWYASTADSRCMYSRVASSACSSFFSVGVHAYTVHLSEDYCT